MRRWESRRSGFTIVELLIVVVVIAILAAVTIVAYNGINNRAKLSAVQTALSQAGKKLETVKVASGAYPADTAALRALGINTDKITAYIVSPASTPNYCLTIIDDKAKLSITSTSGAPIAGECVTNLAMDPRGTTYTSGSVIGWRTGRWFGSGPAAGTYDPPILNALDGPAGVNSYVRKEWTVAPSSIGGQGDSGFGFGPGGTQSFPVVSGDSFAVSSYLRPSSVKNGIASIYTYDSADVSLSRASGGFAVLPAGVWTRQSFVYTPAANVGYFSYTPDISSSAANGATVWASGDTLDGSAAMITKGSTLYSYGDGDSPGWYWNGTPHSSTSTGPAVAQ